MGRRTGALALALLAGVLAGCDLQEPRTKTRTERVQEAFARHADAIAEKEGATAVSTGFLLVGEDRLRDGTRLSYWVSDPATLTEVRSRCDYVDMEDRTVVTAASVAAAPLTRWSCSTETVR
jgi:hypothetical protein